MAFSDIVRLAETLGFTLARQVGSHHIFAHPKFVELVNLQDVGGEAKPYQVRQVVRLVERYDLRVEGGEE